MKITPFSTVWPPFRGVAWRLNPRFLTLSYMAAVSLLCGGNRRLDGCYRENPVALERRRARSSMEKNFVDSHGQSEVAFAFCHLLGTVRLMACL